MDGILTYVLIILLSVSYFNEFFDYGAIKQEKIITVYNVAYGFTIEVDRGEEVTSFYISHENYSDKMYMFGLRNCDISDAEFEETIILANAKAYAGNSLSEHATIKKCSGKFSPEHFS